MPSLATIRGRSVSQAVSRLFLRGGPSSIPFQPMQDVWWTDLLLDSIFPEYVRFSMSLPSHQCPISLTLYRVTRTWLDAGSSLLNTECRVTFVPPCMFLAADCVLKQHILSCGLVK